WAARFAGVMNLRDGIGGAARLTEQWLGLSAKRSLPKWRGKTFLSACRATEPADSIPEVVLLADTFNNYFEPENLHAAREVLEAAPYRVHVARATDEPRPLCCGRTFLAAGPVDEARVEAKRTLDALAPFVSRGLTVV